MPRDRSSFARIALARENLRTRTGRNEARNQCRNVEKGQGSLGIAMFAQFPPRRRTLLSEPFSPPFGIFFATSGIIGRMGSEDHAIGSLRDRRFAVVVGLFVMGRKKTGTSGRWVSWTPWKTVRSKARIKAEVCHVCEGFEQSAEKWEAVGPRNCSPIRLVPLLE